ncbi:MAG: L-arabinose isomerase [Bacteroidota bacterium]
MLSQYEAWFVTGSQHLYGEEALQQVAANAEVVARALNANADCPVKIVFKPILTTPDAIYQLCQEASATPNCIGLICWMHTFSPAKMWIGGLKALQRPFLHLHTQFQPEIPWSEIDMDYMNLHQSAHGGREFGFIGSRMGINRKVVVGHWQDLAVQSRIHVWLRVAAAWRDQQGMKVARFGDNMREVAVTEGNKVSAQITFGYSVNGFGMGDLQAFYQQVSDAAVDQLCEEYGDSYDLMPALRPSGERFSSLQDAARIELAMRAFLEQGNFKAYTDTFENLTGLPQLPGIATQRLMIDGYGFGAEGDWKTAALVRSMKVMGDGLEGGNSFMEDYTYHFKDGKMQVLGAHMLEICPSIAAHKPKCEIHPLGIGGKEDPVRLVFDSATGPAINASIIDLGNRFRLLVNPVEAIPNEQALPKLPVARVLWDSQPNSAQAAEAWIQAGGAHHTCFSLSLNKEYMADYAEMANIEMVLIDENTDLFRFKQELRWNELFYRLS